MTGRQLPMYTALSVLLISGLVHGVWTHRWKPSHALDEACARVAQVPATAGVWKSTNIDVDPEPYKQARAVSYWMRRYTRDDNGGSITVIFMCGRADHMSVHTPDICYRGAGFEMAGDPVKEMVAVSKDQPAAEFWTARFRQPAKFVGQEMRIYWTWSAHGSWQAPASPRWAFGGEPFLYKLYVAHDSVGDAQGDSLTAEFLQQLLPVLEKSLFSREP